MGDYRYLLLILVMVTTSSYAGWTAGEIEDVAIGYDGQSLLVRQKDVNRTDCTCYPTWPNYYCIDNTRATKEEEYSLLLLLLGTGKRANINIDDTTCKIKAIHILNP